MQFKIGDRVHSYITGHYGHVVGFKPNGDVMVSWPAHVSDNDPNSLEASTNDRATGSAYGK